jgi:hypothetical protein
MAKRKKAAKKKSAGPRKLVVPEHKLFAQHKGHAAHLCALVAARQMARVAKLSRGAKYVCHICGRAAAKATNLCEPVAI